VARKQIELSVLGLRQIIVKLWKFSLLSTDGISVDLYLSQSVVSEMTTVQERANCVGWRFETKSVTQTQWNYRNALASTFTRYNTTGFFPVGLCQEQCVPNTI
jgi:hypothetical protein